MNRSYRPPRNCRATASEVSGPGSIVSQRPLRSSTSWMKGTTTASLNSAAFDPNWRNRRCSRTPAVSAISRVVMLR
jgi:hypothetical protein